MNKKADAGESSLRPCLRALWIGRAMPLTRAVASLSAAALLGSLALAMAWSLTAMTGGIEHNTQMFFLTSSGRPMIVAPGTTIPASTPGRTVTYTYHRVDPRPEAIVSAAAIAVVAWLAMLWRIWGPPRGIVPSVTSTRRGWRLWLMPALVSVAIVLAVFAGMFSLEESDFVPGDKRYLGTVILMAAGGVLLTSWLGVIERMQIRFKPILDANGQVDVRCPGCGYLLIGLRELRCPECGMQFTIDELFRAQRYEAPKVS